MTKKQSEFIELYSFQKKNYPEIEKSMNINRKQLLELRTKDVNELVKHIQNVYTKFSDKRKDVFNHDFKKFYNWYEEQGQKCGYCEVTQEELYQLFNKDKRILPYLESTREYKKAPKRSSGTLEIERLDSSDNYNNENIILACPLCNNAKSNLIDEKIGENFRSSYERILQNTITTKDITSTRRPIIYPYGKIIAHDKR